MQGLAEPTVSKDNISDSDKSLIKARVVRRLNIASPWVLNRNGNHRDQYSAEDTNKCLYWVAVSDNGRFKPTLPLLGWSC